MNVREPIRGPLPDPVLDLVDVVVSYPDRRRGRRRTSRVPAVKGVSLRLRRGEALGLVGESGSGKSTLARATVGLVPLESGRILVGDTDLVELRRRDPRLAARRVQMVFQDALGALDPRQGIGSALTEVLTVHGLGDADTGADRATSLLSDVGLGADHFGRFPHQLSGGQRQRVGIARALALSPEVVILDEPVSALDVSVQAQILTLLHDMRTELDLTLLLIAHDLSVVRNVCDRVAVMFQGRIVEESRTDDLFANPRHPYTRDLLAAVPRIGLSPSAPAAASPGEGGIEASIGESTASRSEGAPSGCPYFARCRHPARDEGCRLARPPLALAKQGHLVACAKAR